MYYTYVLLCDEKDFSIGFTENIDNRLKEHIKKEVKTTKKFGKIRLVYFEACNNKTDAKKREIQLKTGFGRGYVKRRIENDLKSRD